MSNSDDPDLDEIEDTPTLPGKRPEDKVFDRFVLKKIVGRGGMGIVWHAFDDNLKRNVALKFVPEIIRFDPAALDDLKHETRQGQSLAHPNIVKIHDLVIDENEGAAIFMELVDGPSLAELRTKQPEKVFQPELLTRWVGQFLDALTYAHENQEIVHRDLKPANLLIDASQNLKVLDFGISRCISESVLRSTMIGNSTGTLAYMSPQQASGSTPSVADDIYSVGSTLYELLTGKPPFHSGNIGAQLREGTAPPIDQRRREFGLKLPPVPANWETAIQACLAKNPDARPASARALASMLGVAESASAPPPQIPAAAAGSTASLADSELATSVTASTTGMVTDRVTAMPHTRGTLRPVDTATWYPDDTRRSKRGGKAKRKRIGLAVAALIAVTAFAGFQFLGNDEKLGEVDRENLQTEINVLLEDKRNAGDIERKLQEYRAGFGEDEFFAGVRAKIDGWGDPRPSSLPVVPDNYKTIAAAIKAAKEGATVKVREGTYDETLHITKSIRLQAEGDVTLRSDDPETSVLHIADAKSVTVVGFNILQSGGDLDRRGPSVVRIDKAGVILENCKISGGFTDGLHISGASTNVTVMGNSVVRDNTEQGILIESSAKASVMNCEITNNGQNGVCVVDLGSDAKITDSKLYENGQSGILAEEGGAVEASKNVVTNNQESGIAVTDAGSAGVFRENEVRDNGIRGIFVGNNGEAKVIKNTVTGNEYRGIEFHQAVSGTEAVDNEVQKHPEHGILVVGASDPPIVVKDNRVSDSGIAGIAVSGPQANARVIANQCHFNSVGIMLNDGAVSEVSENICRENVQYGLLCLKGSLPSLGENDFEENGFAGIHRKGTAGNFARDQGTGHANPLPREPEMTSPSRTTSSEKETDPVFPSRNAGNVPVVSVPARAPNSKVDSTKEAHANKGAIPENHKMKPSSDHEPVLPATNAGNVPVVKLPPLPAKEGDQDATSKGESP